jgi:hypothetical protein
MIPILAELNAHAWENIAWLLAKILFFIVTFIWALENNGKERP